MSKGLSTRESILNRALDLSSEVGLEGLTLGVLAKRTGLSKSGLYAHFDSKEQLQCDVLDTAAARFVDVVLTPAFKRPRGVPRLQRLFELWLRWGKDELSGGCPIMAAVAEFDDRAGPVRERVAAHLRNLLSAIARAAEIAVEAGHLSAKLDTEQFAYEFWGIVVAHQHYSRLLEAAKADARARRAFASLLERTKAD